MMKLQWTFIFNIKDINMRMNKKWQVQLNEIVKLDNDH